MEPDKPEPMPDWVAAMDQVHANVRELAKLVATYHKGLVENGFDEGQAFTLTLMYQQAITAKPGDADA